MVFLTLLRLLEQRGHHFKCNLQCSRKTFMVHHSFVWWALYTPYKFVKSPIRHVALAVKSKMSWVSDVFHLHCNLLNTNYYNLMTVSLKFVLWGPIDKNKWSLVQEVAWWLTSDRPLPEPITTHFTLANWQHQAQGSFCVCAQPMRSDVTM